jgi:FAD/FMN-containing dehydrogenase
MAAATFRRFRSSRPACGDKAVTEAVLAGTADPTLREFAAEVGESGPVAVAGGRTRWSLGGDLDGETRVLAAPAGILEHRPEEMTVRVRAGTTVAELHDALGEQGQRTALPERGGTIGGALCSGENHLSVLGRGRVRNCLLQARYVSSEGRVVTAGGATVKNVTGFDLPRLLIGSLGTLGLLAEVVLRTAPVPEMSVWLASIDADPFECFEAARRAAAVLHDGATVWVLLEGYVLDVEAERAALGRLGAWQEVEGPPALPGCRWSLSPSELRDLDLAGAGTSVASIGVGTVFASEPQPPRTWPAPLVQLTTRIKHAFDPSGRLSPGRDVMAGVPCS